ncbi:MAG: hypothetical protein ACL7BU_10280 [Candidatus Phlomobacter fragariae]
MGGESFSSNFVFWGDKENSSFDLMQGSCIYEVEDITNVVYKYELDKI